MLALTGTYRNGVVKLDDNFNSDTPVKVIVTFLDDVPKEALKTLTMKDFSFAKTRALVKNVKCSFSDEVIKERRSYL